MRRFITFLIFIAFMPVMMNAQTVDVEELEEEVEHAGSEVQVDSTLVGKDIFSVLPGNVILDQTTDVRNAVVGMVGRNSSKMFSGFRIRLYFDSRRGAREQSASVMKRFNDKYPGVQADRSFESPNFKVTVGFFRTRLEADAMLADLKDDFPGAFVVREKFKYPTIGKPEAVVND